MSGSKKPLRQPGYHLEAIDDELFLFHPAQPQMLYINEAASMIWQLCDGQRTPQEIVALLVTAFPEAANRMADDVKATLKQFLEHGAIEFV